MKKLHTVVSKAGIDEETKRIMILGYSEGRTSSSRALYASEAALLIEHIEQRDGLYAARQKMRGKILYLAHEMGWRKPGKEGKMVADGAAIDAWMLKFSYLHKKLDSYTYSELPKLVTQFETVYKHFLKTI